MDNKIPYFSANFLNRNYSIPDTIILSQFIIIGLPNTCGSCWQNKDILLSELQGHIRIQRSQFHKDIYFYGDMKPIDNENKMHFCTTDGDLWGQSGIIKYPQGISYDEIIIVSSAMVYNHRTKKQKKIYIDLENNIIVTD